MLILVDDIKFESEEIFYSYIDTMFPDDTVSGIESLYNVLTAGEPDIEFIISDFNQIKEENKNTDDRMMGIPDFVQRKKSQAEKRNNKQCKSAKQRKFL